MAETRDRSRVEARVLRKAAQARSRTAKEHAETARRATSAAQTGVLQATDAAKKAKKRRRERKFMRKEMRRKMNARDISRGLTLMIVLKKRGKRPRQHRL